MELLEIMKRGFDIDDPVIQTLSVVFILLLCLKILTSIGAKNERDWNKRNKAI